MRDAEWRHPANPPSVYKNYVWAMQLKPARPMGLQVLAPFRSSGCFIGVIFMGPNYVIIC